MPHALRSTALRLLALAGLAGIAGLISNGLASPARRLAWSGSAVTPPSLPSLVVSPVPSEPSAHALAAPSAKAIPPRHAPPAVPQTTSPQPVQPQAAVASAPIREITGVEAWKAHQSGVSFLDARRSAEFSEGHVAGAFCAPVWEADLEDRLITFKAARRPGPEDPIVIYCSGGDCRDSHLLADRLLKEGYFHLLIYRAGFPDWVAQKHPVEKGQP